MTSLVSGFKKAGNNFGKNCESGFDSAWASHGVGGELIGLLGGGKRKALRGAKTKFVKEVWPHVEKPLTESWDKALELWHSEKVQNTCNELSELLNVNKQSITDSFNESMKDVGLSGIDASSFFSKIPINDLKKLKTTLDVSSLTQDPNKYLQTIDPEKMASEVDMSEVQNASLANNSMGFENFDADKLFDGTATSIKLESSGSSSALGKIKKLASKGGVSTGNLDSMTSINIGDVSSELNKNTSLFGGSLDNVWDEKSITNAFEGDIGMENITNQFDFGDYSTDKEITSKITDAGTFKMVNSYLDADNYMYKNNDDFYKNHDIKSINRDNFKPTFTIDPNKDLIVLDSDYEDRKFMTASMEYTLSGKEMQDAVSKVSDMFMSGFNSNSSGFNYDKHLQGTLKYQQNLTDSWHKKMNDDNNIVNKHYFSYKNSGKDLQDIINDFNPQEFFKKVYNKLQDLKKGNKGMRFETGGGMDGGLKSLFD